MLDQQAQALLTGDEQAYLAVLDESNRDLIHRERMVFENLRRLPVDSVDFVVPSPWAEFETPPPPPKQGEYDETAEWLPSGPWFFVPVVKAVTLATDDPGLDLGPGESYEYTVNRRGAGWMISDVMPLNRTEIEERRYGSEYDIGRRIAMAAPPAHTPWILDQLNVAQAGNVWLASDDTVAAGELTTYADVAEEEASKVEQIWGDRPTLPGHIFFLTRDETTLSRWFDLGEEFVGRFSGVAIPQQAVKQSSQNMWGRNSYVGSRMAVNLSRAEEYSATPRLIMRHELTHAVTSTAKQRGEFTVPSAWAVEGFARYIETRGEPDRERGERYWAAQGFDGTLPATRQFYDGDRETVATNYALGYTVFRFAEQLSSLEAAVEFYVRLIQRGSVAVDLFFDTSLLTEEARTELDEIWLDTLGIGVDSFAGQWRSFVRQGG